MRSPDTAPPSAPIGCASCPSDSAPERAHDPTGADVTARTNTTGRSDRAGARLAERLDVLTEIAAIADGRVPPEVAVRTTATTQRARGRLGHGAGHTVVALAGATGSGKSSLFNALAGRELAATGVRRPTTSHTQAAVFTTGSTLRADAAGLLTWLDVRRHAVIDDAALDGLVLLDLPDHDSTAATHRQEVDRLVKVVDVFVWVVDPQKYADAALHHGYLRRFAGHADVTVVVLNQVDTLAAEHRNAALDDLARILAADGLPVARTGVVATVTGKNAGVRVMGVSALTGDGVDALRREIAARVSARRAFVDRIDADIDWIADDLDAALGDNDPQPTSERAAVQLGEALAGAAGVDGVADAVAHAHRRRGVHAAGWPPTRWVSRFKPDPLRRLGLDRSTGDRAATSDDDGAVPSVARTNLPRPSSIATATASTAVRQVVDDAAAGLPALWRERLRTVATERRADLDDALDRAVGATDLPMRRPHWWRVVGVVQWVLAAALAIGLLWLTTIFVVAWLNLPDLPTAEVGALPLPTVLAVGGALLGLLVAALARAANRVGARRRASSTRRRLVAATTGVGRELVIAPIDAELATMATLRRLVRQLRR
jgi:energy-coupling factor transporter ATP-binding protein EcfA2